MFKVGDKIRAPGYAKTHPHVYRDYNFTGDTICTVTGVYPKYWGEGGDGLEIEISGKRVKVWQAYQWELACTPLQRAISQIEASLNV